MNHLVFACLVVLSACLPAAGAVLESRYCGQPPVMDGQLSEAAWQTAPKYSDFIVMQTSQAARRRTELQILHTDTAIIFGLTAYIPADLLPTPEEARKAKVYSTDCVEIMVDPTGGSDSYFHFIVNSVNMRFERSCEQGGYVGNSHWQADWRSAVHRDQDFWSAEIELPYQSLELSGADHPFWSFNAVRESYRLPEGHAEVSSLAAKGVTHTAESFRRLQAPGVDLSPYLWQVGLPNQRQAIVDGQLLVTLDSRVANLGPRDQDVKIEAVLTGANGFLVQAAVMTTMVAGAENVVQFPALQVPSPGLCQGSITVRNRAQNRILSRKRFTRELAFVPMSITLEDPHYRQAIFATQQLEHVRYQVAIHQEIDQAGFRLRSGIRAGQGGQVLCEQTVIPRQRQEFAFPVSAVPDGRWEVFAELQDLRRQQGAAAAPAAAAATPLRKLPYQKNEVWRGKDGNWYVDGQKFFLLSSWGTGDVSRGSDFSVIFKAADDPRPIMYYNTKTGFGFGAAFRARLKQDGATPEVLETYRERARAAKDDPLLFGHYLIDEPDCAGFTSEVFTRIAEAIADEDPYHPIVISTGSGGIVEYLDCGEINGFHCYPRPVVGQPMSNFRKIVVLMDKWRAHWAGATPTQSIAYLHQGFNYGDCGLRDSRVPSYEELRNQNILALILGSVGLLHYNRSELQYPELYLGIPALVAEQKIIGEEAVIHPDAEPAPRASHADLRLLGKANPDGSYWLLACNATETEAEYEVTWPVLADSSLQVLGENRRRPTAAGRFRDRFTPFQARVYTTSRKAFALPSISQVNEDIEAEYARRVKPGNLVYQRFEQQRVQVRASSNKFNSGRPDNCLWHVTDGVCGGVVAKNGHSNGIITYCDATPNQAPDWLEIEFPASVKVSRVVLYPVENSLFEYEIQARQNGEYVTLARVSQADGDEQAVRFPVTETAVLRLLVTATRGPETRLYEWEVYEQ